MPIIHVHTGPLEGEQRAAMADKLTTAANSILEHLPREAFIVVMHEHNRDQVAVGGTLLCDR